jgi:hypothetical protein
VADDSLAGDYLRGREAAQTEDNVRFLQGLAGETATTDVSAAIPAAKEKVEAEDRTKQPGIVGGTLTQAIGGVREAVVEGGKTIEDLTGWLRENTILGELPEGPKLQIKLPKVREPKGAMEELTRTTSQFLTSFIPFFKATRAAGLGLGVSGAVAGAATDFAVFDPNDPRVSNMLNDLAPSLKTPITEYLAADPSDSRAEGKFKNTLEGLALGGMAEGVFRAVKVLRAAKGLSKDELKALATSETGSVTLGGQPGKAAPVQFQGVQEIPAKQGGGGMEMWNLTEDIPGHPKGSTLTRETLEAEGFTVPPAPGAKAAAKPAVTPLVDVKRVTPEQAAEFMAANPDALNLGDRVLKVGWEQLGDQKGLEEVINRTTRVFSERVDVARRGKVSDAQLRVLARELDMPVEDFLGRRTGAALNAEQSLALVSLLGASAKRLRGLAGQVNAGNLDARAAMLDQLSLHSAIQEQAFGARAEAGRALRVWGMQADGTIAHATKLADVAGRMTGRTGEALDAERLAQMVLSLDSPAKLAKMTREATKPGWADMASEYWINALLSNPSTHMVNVLSNTLTAVWALPERALAAQLSRGGEGVVRGEAGAMFWGLMAGTMDGLKLAGKAFKEGVPVRPGTKVENFTRKNISGANMGASGDLGRAIDLLGTGVRLPGRFLMASDEFFKTINFRMELHAQAVRQAGNEGLTGKDAGRRAAALINDPDFLARVKPMADEFADYQTFTKPLGEGGQAISAWRSSHPAAKIVVPFLRTPVNIFKYVGERTPFLNRISSQVRADLAAGGARGDMARARTQLGGMVMASSAVLASSGYITGRGPRDPNLRREWLENNQPYSVKIGGTWHSYNRLDPLGATLGMAADFADIVGELDEVDASQLAAAIGLSVSNNMLSKTYLTGVADILEAIESPADQSARYIRRLGGTIIPAGVAQAARYVDPTMREVNSTMDAIIARVPGWSSSLPARLNLWAEPIKYTGGLGPDIASPIYTRSADTKPVSEEMVRQGVSVGMPGKWVFGGRPGQSDPLAEARTGHGVPLEPEEYAQYVKLAAGHGLGRLPLLKDKLAGLIASDTYKRQTDGQDGGKALLIKDIIGRYRAAAQAKLISDSPQLQAQLRAKLQGRGEALRPKKAQGLLPQAAQQGVGGSTIGDLLR